MPTVADESQAESGRFSVVVASSGAALLSANAVGLLGKSGDLIFPALALGTLAAVAAGIRTYRPRPIWVWWLSLASLVLFFTGAALRTTLGTLGDLSAGRSALPEPFTIAGYLTLGLMIYGIGRERLGRRWRNLNATLDASIAGLAALALAWIYLITPALTQQEISVPVRLALSSYPALSIFLLVIGFRFATGWGSTPPFAYYSLLVALTAMLVGDVVYMLVEMNLVEVARWTDLPYGIGFVAWATTATHPTMRNITDRITTVESTPRRGLSVVAAAVAVPGLVLLARPQATAIDRAVLAVIVIALMVTSGLRVYLALSDHARSEARLLHLVKHDQLTDLPNRAWIDGHLTDIFAGKVGHGPAVTLLFLDVDRFKVVNDRLGHPVGDELLRAVARRLSNTCRAADVVARFGGDEFVVLLTSVRDQDEATEIAERTRLTFGAPFVIDDIEVTTTTSIGVRYVDDWSGALTASAVIRDADTAMYAAKEAGGNAVVVFDERMQQRVSRHLALEGEVRSAAVRGQFSLNYQPIVDVIDGRVTGLEALIRWDHPELGRVPPADFIPVCEEIGYIVELGGWVLDQAIAELARIRSTIGHTDQLSMAVNVSVRQLRDPRFTDRVARAVLESGIPPATLCLEITESLLVENIAELSETLTLLRSFGVRIAIDDFGTGYSSLSYLRRLPVDEMKIDREFVTGLGLDTADDSVVAAMLAMGDALGFSIVAEGVETSLQQERLVALGCRHAQGYVFSPPVTADDVPAVLEQLGLAAAPRLRVIRDLA